MRGLSVILPVYNAHDSIERAINSVLGQDLEHDYELIIIDDGSTDDTASIIKKFSHEKAVVVIRQENKGLISSCNIAVRTARFDKMIRIDADDEFAPKSINRAVCIFEETGKDVVFFSRIQIDGNTEKRFFMDGNVFHTIACGNIYRKKALFDIGLYSDLLFEEYDLHIRLMQKFTCGFSDFITYRYYLSNSKLTREKNYWQTGYNEICKKFRRQTLVKFGIEELENKYKLQGSVK